jgi:hypothetical protein
MQRLRPTAVAADAAQSPTDQLWSPSIAAAIENFEDGRMSLSVTFLDADFLDAIDQRSCASHLKTSQETRVEAAMLP